MTGRRDFVKTLGGAVLGYALRPRAPSPDPRAPLRSLNRIGLELYSVRDAMHKDPEGTLAAVRAMGYTDVELLWSFGNFGRTTEQVRAALDHEGLHAPSAYVSPGVGRPLQRRRRRGPARGYLARLPQRGGPHDAHRRHRTVRRVRAANRLDGRPPPARRRQHDHGWWRPVRLSRAVPRSLLELPSEGRREGSLARHGARHRNGRFPAPADQHSGHR